MKWIIDKEFAACFGHRVHNQRLDTRFTDKGDACLACRHLHGHQMIVKVFLESTNIDQNDMVTDFKHLGWFKNFMDDVIDHKFMMDIQDPLFKSEFPLCMGADGILKNVIQMKESYWIPDMTFIQNETPKWSTFENEQQAIFEKYEGAVFVDFTPTSERLVEWLFKIVEDKMQDLENVTVNAVEYWETPKSHSRYER